MQKCLSVSFTGDTELRGCVKDDGGGRFGILVPKGPYGLCGRKAALNYLRVSSVLLPPIAQAISPVYYGFAACVWHSDRMVYVYASHVNRSRRVTLQNWICVLSVGGSLLLLCLSVCQPVRLSVSASVSRSPPNTCSLFTDPSRYFPSPTSVPLTRLCIVSL